MLITVVLLCGSGSLIFCCQLKSRGLKMKYPLYHCSEEYELYTGSDGIVQEDKFKSSALDEFMNNYNAHQNGEKTSYEGAYQCYCTWLKENTSKKAHRSKDVEIDGGEKVALCDQYFGDEDMSEALSSGIPFVIIGVNLIMKTLIVALIKWIKEDTCSVQYSSMTSGVFIAQFFNTGILLLLVNANMSEFDYFPTRYVKAGNYHDYMPEWYSDVGQKITQTMLINAVLPYVFLLKGFIVPRIVQAFDNGFSGSPYATRKTSMAQYKILYSGPQYHVHIKNAGLLAIVYTTCMYGMAMPLLFPLAALRFFNLWVCERIRVAYLVKLPPALDDELTNSCIRMLKYAPLLLVCNGYWMLSNP